MEQIRITILIDYPDGVLVSPTTAPTAPTAPTTPIEVPDARRAGLPSYDILAQRGIRALRNEIRDRGLVPHRTAGGMDRDSILQLLYPEVYANAAYARSSHGKVVHRSVCTHTLGHAVIRMTEQDALEFFARSPNHIAHRKCASALETVRLRAQLDGLSDDSPAPVPTV